MKPLTAILIVIDLFCIQSGLGQNLILNPSFELKSNCPDTHAQSSGQLNVCLNWVNPSTGWPSGSPDYFNSCAYGTLDVPKNFVGYQQARTGQAYCGIGLTCYNEDPEFREYIEAPLNAPLLAGTCYHFEMYISSPNNFTSASDAIQVYFSDTLISIKDKWSRLQYTPQLHNPTGNYPDTLSWKLMEGDYMANGGEKFLVIGNFLANAYSNAIPVSTNAAYVYIDDVSLVLKPVNCFAVSIVEARFDYANIFPQPVNDKLNIELEPTLLERVKLEIMDAFGQLVFSKNKIDPKEEIALSFLQGGFYYVKLSSDTRQQVFKIIKE